MPSEGRATARFTQVTAVREGGRSGVRLRFQPVRGRLEVDAIEDFAELGPVLTIPAVSGLGKVLRILRAARVAAPRDPLELVGREERAAGLLARALGTLLSVGLRRRSRLRFVAWTEDGPEVVEDVAEVREHDDAFFVVRSGGRFPVRIERSAVLRHRTQLESWYEILDIERA